MAPVIAAVNIIGEFGSIFWTQSRLTVKRAAAFELPSRLDLVACQMLRRPQRRPYHPRMQNGELLVAERSSPSGQLTLQKGWRRSADKVLRAGFALCLRRNLTEAQDSHKGRSSTRAQVLSSDLSCRPEAGSPRLNA